MALKSALKQRATRRPGSRDEINETHCRIQFLRPHKKINMF